MGTQAGTRKSVALCLIVRNEMPFLRLCVESVREYVDQVCVLDTGSVDGTERLARELADAYDELPFDGDFSRARNAALGLADTAWVLFLDADERMTPGQARLVRDVVESAEPAVFAYTFMRYNLFANGGFYSNRIVRLIRRADGVQFERRINESVKPSIEALGGRVADAPVFLNHFGHCRSVKARNGKAERYIDLMKRQLADRPGDGVLEGYVALNLRVLGRFAEALEWSERSIRSAPDHPVALAFRGHVLRSVGDVTGARVAYAEAHRIGDDAASLNMVGVTKLGTGDLDGARADFVRALELEPLLLAARINIGLTYQAEGAWERAAAELANAATVNPAFLVDEWQGRTEVDCFRGLYNETVFGYVGLGYHLAYCERQAQRPLEVVKAGL